MDGASVHMVVQSAAPTKAENGVRDARAQRVTDEHHWNGVTPVGVDSALRRAPVGGLVPAWSAIPREDADALGESELAEVASPREGLT